MELLTFKNLSAQPGLIHFQTTRSGGYSQGAFATTNMSYSVGDDAAAVQQNREKLASQIGVEVNRFVFIKQTHSTHIAVVTEADCGRGVWPYSDDKISDTDGAITNCPGVVIGVKTADCIPVLVYDPVQRAVGAFHAGWRGTAGRIVPQGVEMMQRQYGSRPADLIVGIGAGAGFCCYQTDEEVYNKIRASLASSSYPTYDQNLHHIDLKEINRLQLIECGLLPANIEVSELCSICNPHRLFSHRASGGHTGRSLTGICIAAR